MNRSKKDMQAINYEHPQAERHSLKQKLVAAVANGNDTAADELRLLLKMKARERLPGSQEKS